MVKGFCFLLSHPFLLRCGEQGVVPWASGRMAASRKEISFHMEVPSLGCLMSKITPSHTGRKRIASSLLFLQNPAEDSFLVKYWMSLFLAGITCHTATAKMSAEILKVHKSWASPQPGEG